MPHVCSKVKLAKLAEIIECRINESTMPTDRIPNDPICAYFDGKKNAYTEILTEIQAILKE